jgi:hypothetical protein
LDPRRARGQFWRFDLLPATVPNAVLRRKLLSALRAKKQRDLRVQGADKLLAQRKTQRQKKQKMRCSTSSVAAQAVCLRGSTECD